MTSRAVGSSIEGGGYPRTVTGTNPPAGSDIAEGPPTGARWQLRTFSATLATSATVATRRPTLQYVQSGSVTAKVPQPATQAASLSARYFWSEGVPFTVVVGTTSNITAVVSGPILLAGDGVQTATENFQAGDDWGAPIFTVTEWLEVQS